MDPRLKPGLLALLLLQVACAATPPARDAGATFVVVRHAEKADDRQRDPPLSEAGLQRAQLLAGRLADAPLVAVYSTDYLRTRQTAQPSAAAHGLTAETYDPARPAAEFVSGLKALHRSGTVLVTGHSNTVPALVSALCDCATSDMADTEYDRVSVVRIDAAGRATLEVTRYGAAAPIP